MKSYQSTLFHEGKIKESVDKYINELPIQYAFKKQSKSSQYGEFKKAFLKKQSKISLSSSSKEKNSDFLKEKLRKQAEKNEKCQLFY